MERPVRQGESRERGARRVGKHVVGREGSIGQEGNSIRGVESEMNEFQEK